MTTAELVGRNIRRLRKSRGLKQTALAEMCGYSAKASGTISKIERGRIAIDMNVAGRIARALEVDLPELFQGVALAESDTSHQAIIDHYVPSDRQAFLSFLCQLEDNLDNLLVLCRKCHEKALRQGQPEGDVQLPVSPDHLTVLDLFSQLEGNLDSLLGCCRRHAEALRHGQPEESVYGPGSLSQRTTLRLPGPLRDFDVGILISCADVLRQGQASVATDLDRLFTYIKDALELRRLQQGEEQGGAEESAPAG